MDKNKPIMIDSSAILLLYNKRVYDMAPTLMEYINELTKYSQFSIFSVNTENGFPGSLKNIKFSVIILHYSLFAHRFYAIDNNFLNYLKEAKSYKIAILQDEHCFCQQRFRFLNKYNIDCIFTLVDPNYYDQVYTKYTKVPKIITCLPGYVSENLIELANKYSKLDADREIDIGYRGRILPYCWGRGGQEKSQIALEFSKRVANMSLNLDIEIEEEKRIYGDDWYRFLGNCKACLGVEAGVSIFDLEDVVYQKCENYITQKPDATFEELSEQILNKWESNIEYRTISPRHFEAAAFKVCQILFEGNYSGILKPMIHYIPLKKDFSNFDEVMKMYNNVELRQQISENAYNDLIKSGKYSYKNFANSFDQELINEGIFPEKNPSIEQKISIMLLRGKFFRDIRARILYFIFNVFPGKQFMFKAIKPYWEKYMQMKQNC